MIDFERVDGPVCLCKGGWVVAHIVDARLHASGARSLRTTRVGAIRVAGVVPTEGIVKDDIVQGEMGVNIAGTLKVG